MKAHPVVFFVSAVLVVLFVIAGAAFPTTMGNVFAAVQEFNHPDCAAGDDRSYPKRL